MPNIYAQCTSIKSAVGRLEYITDEKYTYDNDQPAGRIDYITGKSGRQEEVVLHVKKMLVPWHVYEQYEEYYQHQSDQKQNVAREIIIALPNELAGAVKGTTTSAQKETLGKICNDLANEILGEGHDWESAVHWNHDRTNLHVHMMYSERRVIGEHKIKQYKRDYWINPVTRKFTKASAEGAVLLHKKGDPVLDESGNPIYEDVLLSAKDPRFKSKSFLRERNLAIQKVLDSYGYHLDIQDETTPYLSQRKLYKYANDDYKEAAKQYNDAVKEYNAAVKKHIELDPSQKENYKAIRSEVEKEVRQSNSTEKKISVRAIDAVKKMTVRIEQFIQSALHRLTANVSSWWHENKETYLSAFRSQLTASSENPKENVTNGTKRSTGTADPHQPAELKNIRAAKSNPSTDQRSSAERIAALRSFANSRKSESSDYRQSISSTAERKSQKNNRRIGLQD